MVFSSLFFIFLFLPLNLIFYFTVKNRKIKNIILVLFSLIFYAWGEPIWVSLLIFSSLIDYLNGLFIEKHFGKPIAKLGLYSTLFFNLGILITFKYSDFIVQNVNAITNLNFKEPGFLMPIGISFYAFQTISYTIDVYRGEVKAQRSFLNFLLFVSLYHQLVAGPIVRYSHIAQEINERIFSWTDFNNGVSRFCIGLFKKVCIANIAGEICSHYLSNDLTNITVLGGWLGIITYSIQIYFDFSGYSDMAIGMGWMFGFHYHENFKYPYISTSITDFWRRWHISLGTFFKDYVYIPLGGNKKYIFRNILIVWALTGLWHGASWNFIIWGMYFGILLLIEKVLLNTILKKIPKIFSHLYAIFFIVIGWAIFYFTDFSQLLYFMKLIFNFTNQELYSLEVENMFFENIYWLGVAFVLCVPIYTWFYKFINSISVLKHFVPLITICLNLLLLTCSVILLVGSSYNPFIYFRF
jgi:alginate O-acetyltransferase complex protein AlgI